ncbi:hypothetical protein BHE74_00056837 [Ensete ventricosum]|nr:hypothetical protein GW17_00006915 [Ensete ventricosum]RWW37972.1 hypothetical protein BHE74_00056837 [Ensete ventricosum]
MFCLWHYLEKKKKILFTIRIIVTQFTPTEKVNGTHRLSPCNGCPTPTKKGKRSGSVPHVRPRNIFRGKGGYSRDNEKEPSAVKRLRGLCVRTFSSFSPDPRKGSCALLTSMSVHWRIWWDELRQGGDSSLKLPPSLASAALIDGRSQGVPIPASP